MFQKLNSYFKVIFIILVNWIFLACTVSSSGINTTIPLSSLEDERYLTAYRLVHKNISVVNKFQNIIDVNAVMLSENFMQAYTNRLHSLKGANSPGFDFIDQIKGNKAFIVSIYSPDRAYNNIDNKKLWNAELMFADKTIANTAVIKLTDKTELDPYFPFLTRWSQEYLLLFNSPELDKSGDNYLKFNLVLRSAIANVELSWN